MPFPPMKDKKKTGPMIAVGLGPMDALEDEKPAGKPKFPKPTAEHEAAETPEFEADEEAGAGMLAEIESAGEEHGLDASQSRAFAKSVFSAALKCLAGREDPIAEHDAGGMELEGEE